MHKESMHKKTTLNAQRNRLNTQIHWMHKGNKCHSDSMNAQTNTNHTI